MLLANNKMTNYSHQVKVSPHLRIWSFPHKEVV